MADSLALVLIVEDDPAMRRLVRTGLELEGYSVLEAASVAQARALIHGRVAAVVLDRRLPDGDGFALIEEIEALGSSVLVIAHTSEGVPEGMVGAEKGDVNGILDLLADGLHPPEVLTEPESAVAAMVRTRAHDVWDEWVELCRWDPELPPDSQPAAAEAMIVAISDAVERPQPLGWGLDPALGPVVEALALNAPSLDVAMAQLVCLREAFERIVVSALAPTEQSEANRRLNMVVLRMMTVVARFSVSQLQAEAFTDPLTGLANRRAFDIDLERERARVRRHRRPLSVAVIDVDNLKEVNDQRGHQAGDRRLRALAVALSHSLRREDRAYRIGGDEFAVLLPDTVFEGPEPLLDRLAEAGAPPCTAGVASFPGDPVDELVEVADRRLYAARGLRRGRTAPPRGRRRNDQAEMPREGSGTTSSSSGSA